MTTQPVVTEKAKHLSTIWLSDFRIVMHIFQHPGDSLLTFGIDDKEFVKKKCEIYSPYKTGVRLELELP